MLLPNDTGLLAAQHGLERETLRVNQDGTLALTSHPKAVSDPLADASITTDFSESQLELITAPHESVDQAIAELKQIHQRVLQGLSVNEKLWPSSMPSILPAHEDIPIAKYGEGPEAALKEKYRSGLALRYGKYVQMLSGVHYNLSFADDLWQWLYVQREATGDLQAFKNKASLGLVRNFIRSRWLLSYLTGATPFRHESYQCKKLTCFEMKQSIALRQSRCGYHNPEAVRICYNTFETHLASIEKALNTPHPPYTALGTEEQINDHLLQIPNEYYFPIRMKPTPGAANFFAGLQSTGVSYFEVRLLDIDPHEPTGVNADSLRLSHLYLLYCLLTDSPSLSWEEYRHADTIQQEVVVSGRQKLPLARQVEGEKILTELKTLAPLLGLDYQKTIDYFIAEFQQPKNLPWRRMINEMRAQDLNFIDYHLMKSDQHSTNLHD